MINPKSAFEIKRKIQILGDKTKNFTKQLNIVKWGGNDDCYDIRTWDCDGNPGKGICLKTDEAIQLMQALQDEFNFRIRKIKKK